MPNFEKQYSILIAIYNGSYIVNRWYWKILPTSLEQGNELKENFILNCYVYIIAMYYVYVNNKF